MSIVQGITIKTVINFDEDVLTSIGGRSPYKLSRLSVASSHVLASRVGSR